MTAPTEPPSDPGATRAPQPRRAGAAAYLAGVGVLLVAISVIVGVLVMNAEVTMGRDEPVRMSDLFRLGVSLAPCAIGVQLIIAGIVVSLIRHPHD